MRLFFKKMPKRFWLFLSGALLGMTVIFAKLGILAYFALIPAGIIWFQKLNNCKYRVKSAYLDGFVFYMSFDLVCFHWLLYFYPLEFLDFTKAEALSVILLGWVGLSFLQSVFSAFVFVLARWLSNTDFCRSYPVAVPFCIAALFAVNEWTQTLTWAGVPWARIAISQTELPALMQSASLFGSYGISFIVVAVNMLLAFAFVNVDKKRLAALTALGVFLVNAIFGTAMYFIPFVDMEESVTIAAVQGNFESQSTQNIPVSEKYAVYEAQTVKAAEAGADIVIWPETVIYIATDIKFFYKGAYRSLSERAGELAKECGVTLIVGNFIEDFSDTYNCVSVFYPNGEQERGAYSKTKLVPFGEYVPMRELITSLFPILGEINMLGTDISAGGGYSPFDSVKDGDSFKIGALICFDSIYESTAISTVAEGAQALVISSNDSWFYDSRALYMHHSQNILRAVEMGRYTVNCGNTGVTSIISDKGEIKEIMPIYEQGFILGVVYPSNHVTLYSIIGNTPIYFLIFCILILLIWDMINSKFLKKDTDARVLFYIRLNTAQTSKKHSTPCIAFKIKYLLKESPKPSQRDMI